MEKRAKHFEYNMTTGEEKITYFTDEEMVEILERERINKLENSLLPTKEEIDDAEYEIKLLNKLTEWGVIL